MSPPEWVAGSRPPARWWRVLGQLAVVLVGLMGFAGTARASVGDLSLQGCTAEVATSGCVAGSGLKGLHGVVVSPDGADVYAVGHPSGTGQVVELQRNTSTGAVTDIGCIAEGGSDGCVSGTGLNGGAGIAISPDGSDVYVAADTSSSVAVLARNATTGALSETGCVAEAGADGCTAGTGLTGATGIAISPDGANVYVTSEISNAIVVFSRNPFTGALTQIDCLAEAGAEGCTAGTGLTHAENVTVSPDGKEVYATGYDADSVLTFARSATTGALTESACVAEAGADGCAPGHGLDGADGIAISPDGVSVYVAAETSSALATFTRAAAGALAEQACTAETAGDTCTHTAGLTGVARVALSADGQSAYATGYIGNTLDTFTRSAAGALTSQGTCLGASGNADGCATIPGLVAPAGLAVSPDGHNVYTGALTSNALDTFARAHPASAPPGTSTSPNGTTTPGPPPAGATGTTATTPTATTTKSGTSTTPATSAGRSRAAPLLRDFAAHVRRDDRVLSFVLRGSETCSARLSAQASGRYAVQTWANRHRQAHSARIALGSTHFTLTGRKGRTVTLRVSEAGRVLLTGHAKVHTEITVVLDTSAGAHHVAHRSITLQTPG